MNEPRWLTPPMVEAFHADQIGQHQGRAGLRDANLLESALHRPIDKWHYGEADLAALAAAYGFGLASNHPFIDGNKRVAFVAIAVFLGLNGYRLGAEQAEVVEVIRALAAGERSESDLAVWVGSRIGPRTT